MSRRIISDHTLIGALLLLAQLGSGTPGSGPLGALERSVTRPLPQAPAPTVRQPSDVWVPDRFLSDPAHGGTSVVPGHWERRLSDGEYYAPPSTVCNAVSGCSTVPAGERPSPDTRMGP